MLLQLFSASPLTCKHAGNRRSQKGVCHNNQHWSSLQNCPVITARCSAQAEASKVPMIAWVIEMHAEKPMCQFLRLQTGALVTVLAMVVAAADSATCVPYDL